MPQPFDYIEFESNTEYAFLRDAFSKNSNFKLPIWKSNDNNKAREILIMINGFLEGVDGDQKHREKLINIRYGAIANKLLEKKISSVLLPLPFHFNRSFDVIQEGEFAPLSRLTESGTYLYYGGFTQIVSDVQKLMQDIENNRSKFGLLEDTTDIKFHLLGYSIGGVAAIGAALNIKAEQTPKLESLSVLLSAWNLAEIQPNAIENAFGRKFGFSSDMWNNMLHELEE
ncbi:MAG: hypothetical protein ACK50E_02000, partial [Bacteroidota bacterium]